MNTIYEVTGFFVFWTMVGVGLRGTYTLARQAIRRGK